MTRNVLVINGPNLNLLGTREPTKYGNTTLDNLIAGLTSKSQSLDIKLFNFQSNWEGAIVDRIQQAASPTSSSSDRIQAIIINPGAYTHTSVAIRDALLGVGIPFVEVHISNIHAREPFRHHSYLSDVAACTIVGAGVYGYSMALDFVKHSVLDK